MKEKNIPSSLEECTQSGIIPKRWWQMGSVLEVIGSIVMLLMELGSLVGIILVGIKLAESGILNTLTGILYVIIALFACAFMAFIFFCIYKFMALVFYTKSTMVYNSDVVANIAIKNSVKGSEEK